MQTRASALWKLALRRALYIAHEDAGAPGRGNMLIEAEFQWRSRMWRKHILFLQAQGEINIAFHRRWSCHQIPTCKHGNRVRRATASSAGLGIYGIYT